MSAVFRVVDRAPDIAEDTRVIVAEALVPVRWWRGVPAREQAALRLTSMERFVLELAATFGPAAPAEFTEVTDLPSGLFPLLGRRLVGAGLLNPDGTPTHLAAGLLGADEVFAERARTVDVVCLPATGETILLDPAGSGRGLRRWDSARVRPIGQYPVDDDLVGSTVGDLIGAGNIVSDDDTVAFPDGLCPVYRCTARVIDGSAVRLSIGENVSSIELTGVDRLVAAWSGADRAMTERPLSAWRALVADRKATGTPPQLRPVGPAQWELAVTGKHADLLAAVGRNLAVPVGLAIETDDVIVEVSVRAAAVDDGAAAAIGVDAAIAGAVTAGSAAGVVHERLAGLAGQLPPGVAKRLAPAAVLDRAWRLGHYPLAYALRAAEDFDYA